MPAPKGLVRPIVWSALLLAVAALVGGCGGATAASTGTSAAAAATPTCPPTVAFSSVAGTIASVSGNTLTVTSASGTSTQVTLAPNARVTKLVTARATDLAAGTRVQVTTDAATTTAQRILVVPPGAGTGGVGFRGASATGTPGARFNRACLRQNGQGQAGARFAGLAGTVDSASSTQLVLDDPQGQTFTLAITPATVIETSAAGQVSDLAAGAKVLVTGTKTAGGITARSITVES